jgi:hypothetical protein
MSTPMCLAAHSDAYDKKVERPADHLIRRTFGLLGIGACFAETYVQRSQERTTIMRHINVDLTTDERDLLVRILEEALGEEESRLHRTHLASMPRQELPEEANVLRELLDKLMQAHPELGM